MCSSLAASLEVPHAGPCLRRSHPIHLSCDLRHLHRGRRRDACRQAYRRRSTRSKVLGNLLGDGTEEAQRSEDLAIRRPVPSDTLTGGCRKTDLLDMAYKLRVTRAERG